MGFSNYFLLFFCQVGFSDYCSKFQDCQIDGDMLLQMQEEDLIESICMTPGMTRKRLDYLARACFYCC